MYGCCMVAVSIPLIKWSFDDFGNTQYETIKESPHA